MTFPYAIQYLQAHDNIIADKRGRLNIALKELLRALKYAFVQSEIINANATPILNWCIFPAAFNISHDALAKYSAAFLINTQSNKKYYEQLCRQDP